MAICFVGAFCLILIFGINKTDASDQDRTKMTIIFFCSTILPAIYCFINGKVIGAKVNGAGSKLLIGDNPQSHYGNRPSNNSEHSTSSFGTTSNSENHEGGDNPGNKYGTY